MKDTWPESFFLKNDSDSFVQTIKKANFGSLIVSSWIKKCEALTPYPIKTFNTTDSSTFFSLKILSRTSFVDLPGYSIRDPPSNSASFEAITVFMIQPLLWILMLSSILFFLQRISCLAQNLVLSWRFCRLRFFTCCLLNLLLLLHLTKLVHQVDFLLIQFQNFIRSHLFFTFDLHLELFYASWYRIAFDIAFVVDGDELFFTSWLLTVIVVQKFWDGSWSHLLTVD